MHNEAEKHIQKVLALLNEKNKAIEAVHVDACHLETEKEVAVHNSLHQAVAKVVEEMACLRKRVSMKLLRSCLMCLLLPCKKRL